MRASLVTFGPMTDPAGEAMLAAAPGIAFARLEMGAPRAALDPLVAAAHGYQALPRGELRAPWFCDAAFLARAPALLAACSTGAGFDVIDVEACTAAGVIVCHQSGTNAEAVAEHALGLMLALSKRFVETDRALRRGNAPDRYDFTGRDIHGKVLGIVGLGAIGTRLAAICRAAFAMEVLAFDPHLDEAACATRGAAKVGLEELLERSDFVSVHCPRDATTLGMLGAAAFARMKPTAYFIQTARGGIHDEAALAAALREGRIAGAGLDVWAEEPPPPGHPLLALPNVIASPHNAGITAEALRRMATAAAEQWIDIFAGRVPPRLVNPEAWPRYAARFREAFGAAPDASPG